MTRRISTILMFLIASLFIFPGFAAIAGNTLLNPEVRVSSEAVLQGGTILVVVKNEPNEISGSLGSINLHFFRDESNKDWVAITGMTVNKKPGEYKLLINVPNKPVFEKFITVFKRDFPVTRLLITPQLSQKGYTAKNIIANTANENKILAKVLNVVTPISYINKPFIYPLSEIKDVGSFGSIRKSDNYTVRHLGQDLKALINTLVYSANDGKVVLVKSLRDYGNIVIIDHGLGVYSLYLHLGYFNVKEGQMIKRGDLVGLSGNTGYSVAPHLHFSISARGASLDPLKFIQATQGEW